MKELKPLPSSQETEKSLLGCFLIDSEVVERFFENGQIEWFYHYGKIAEVISELAFVGRAVDIVSVSEALESKGLLEKLGGLSFLMELTESVPNSLSWETYSDIIEEKAKLRALIEGGNKLISLAESGKNTDEGVEKVFSFINNSLGEGKSKSVDLISSLDSLEKQIEENKKGGLVGWSWGIKWLDENLGGIKTGKTYRIGAPSGTGKTNLIYGTIVTLLEQGARVMFASLENSIETTLMNIIATKQGVNSQALERGDVVLDTEWIKQWRSNLYITDQVFDIEDIKRECLKNKPDVLILDYIGQVHIKGRNEKEVYEAYGKIAKEFVQRCNKWLSLIDLSNLNKDDDEIKIKQHKGYNGSASLRNNTDIGMFLLPSAPFEAYKSIMMNGENEEVKKRLETLKAIKIYIAKQRGGVDGIERTFSIDFNKGYTYKETSPETIKAWEDKSF